MDITLKDFQVDAVAELAKRFESSQILAGTGQNVAVLLNAPTGSGKTVIMTALIDQLLGGDPSGNEGDPELTFVWLTDDPELNNQSAGKMLGTSSVLSPFDVLVVDSRVNYETFVPGKV